MNWKELIRADDIHKLQMNWIEQQPLKGTPREIDLQPVVKLFNPLGCGTWLVTECDEEGLAIGLADVGYPEIGYFHLQEIAEVELLGGLVRIEQDLHFEARKTLSEYAAEARQKGHIVA